MKKNIKFLLTFILLLILPTTIKSNIVIDTPGEYYLTRLQDDYVLFGMIEDEMRVLYNLSAVSNPGGGILLADVSDRLTISASDVSLQLGNHRLTGGIDITGSRVSISNGYIDGSNNVTNGISASPGAQDISIRNVTVYGATTGINFDGVNTGLIDNCDFIQNTTGLFLHNASNIAVNDSRSVANLNTGFELLSSVTCCFTNCKALSTGEGNNGQFVQTIVGFMSQYGNANIFENCIANNTHGSQVADEASWVAGFLLQGNEQCSKIINCESANTFAGLVLTDTNIAPLAVPQGISLEIELLEESLALLDQENSGGSVTTGGFMHVAWSPDNEYVAVTYNNGLNSVGGLFVYKFDKATGLLTKTVGINNPLLTDPPYTDRDAYGVAWSPNGQYIVFGKDAAGGSTELFMSYEFNRDTFELSFKDSIITAVALGMAFKFTSNGEYGFSLARGDIVRSFSFDQSTGLIGAQIDSYTPSGAIRHMMDISPDDKFLAIGTNTFVDILPTNGDGTFNLSQVLSLATPAGDVIDLAWHPSGRYLAIATFSDKKIHMYAFNGTFPLSLTPVGTVVDFNINTGGAFSLLNKQIAWSPRGDFLVVTLNNTNVRVYSFNFDSGQLTTAQNFDTSTGPLGLSFVGSVDWSSDGRYIAISNGYPDNTTGPNPGVEGLTIINSGYVEPQKNIIMRNTVYCTSGGGGGIGIYGNNVANLIIQNTVYNNPINLQVGSALDEIISQIDEPTLLQNIAIPADTPILFPADNVLTTQQIKYKLCYELSTAFDNFNSIIDTLIGGGLGGGACASTAIGAPTTINASGIYCLGSMINGAIGISASNVYLNLNNYRVTQGITVAAGLAQIKIENGVVENSASSDVVKVNSGCSNITLQSVILKNGLRGISFEQVSGGLIKNCDMISNTTGLELDTSNNIIIDSCNAIRNKNAGFCLLQSTTNCVRDCNALSTGQGNNNVLNQTIFGFVSADGNANIFERCIANATQALSTTDAQSLVAGFALRGSEGCSKIIECEAANAQTNISGVTVPYGILLEAQFDGLVSVTAEIVTDIQPANQQPFAWSPDGTYLAVALDDINTLAIYEFDRVAGVLNKIIEQSNSNGPLSVAWHPDGIYLAVGFNVPVGVVIYKFDKSAESLTAVASNQLFNATIPSVAWSSDGAYLAAALFSSDLVQVYTFDSVTETLTTLVNASGNNPTSVAWSPDDAYLAATIVLDSLVQVYSFDATTPSLTAVDSESGTGPIRVDWNPDGKYLAAAFVSGTVRVYEFDRAAQDLILRDSKSGTTPTFVNWTADGDYLAASLLGDNLVPMYSFDRSTKTLTLAGSASGGAPVALAFSPDSANLVVAFSDEELLTIYQALTFPSKNVIINNTVYCNSGGNCPFGVGISGSSIQNLIIGNIAYSNPIMPSIVGSNYVFVTNVFNQLFGDAPTALQNISVDCNEVLLTPPNNESLADQLLTNVQALAGCAPTPITSADISGGTVSIIESGNYCVATDLTADFSITATCVTVNLNGRCITGTVNIATSDNVKVENGFIKPPAAFNGIIIESTSNFAYIDKVTVFCEASSIAGGIGISCAGNDAQITDCMIQGGDGGNGTDGGEAIVLTSDATRTLIENCVLISGNGSDDVTTGGDGGHGIHVNGSAQTTIRNCIIFATGNGGSSAGTNGDGGDGIFIATGSVDTQVTGCTIRNTGAAGSGGGAAGVGGKAVNDDVAAGANGSQVFGNFAHNIANTIRFDLQASGVESGVVSPNPPTGTMINPLANVYT